MILATVGVAGKLHYDERRSRAILTLLASRLHVMAEVSGADSVLTPDDVAESMRADGIGGISPFWTTRTFAEVTLFVDGEDEVCLLTYTKRSPGLYLLVVREEPMRRLSREQAEAFALDKQGTHLHLIRDGW